MPLGAASYGELNALLKVVRCLAEQQPQLVCEVVVSRLMAVLPQVTSPSSSLSPRCCSPLFGCK